jgi:hypothetical protein
MVVVVVVELPAATTGLVAAAAVAEEETATMMTMPCPEPLIQAVVGGAAGKGLGMDNPAPMVGRES